jgi:hypothetical protein
VDTGCAEALTRASILPFARFGIHSVNYRSFQRRTPRRSSPPPGNSIWIDMMEQVSMALEDSSMAMIRGGIIWGFYGRQ